MIEAVTETMRRAIADRRIVGTVVVIARDGEILHREAAGSADRESGEPMNVDAVFRLASLTKPIVTAATFALIEAGKLSLDDPIEKHLPHFHPRMPDGTARTVTIASLLTHTSGLTYAFAESDDGPYHRERVSDGLGEPGVATEDEIARISKAGLVFEPGTRWQYSLGMDVVGFALENAGGQSLPDLIERLVTKPLGMTHTAFFARAGQTLVTPYADGTPEPIPMSDPQLVRRPGTDTGGATFSPARAYAPESFPSGGAGMIGTADDMLRFFEAMRGGGAGIISKAGVAAMMRNQTASLPIVMGAGWGFGYGAAVLVDPAAAKSPQSAGTWQWGGAYGHSWFVDPARQMSVVALTNTAYEGMNGRYPTQVRDAVYRSMP